MPANHPGMLKEVCGQVTGDNGSICGLAKGVHEFAGHEYLPALVIVGVGNVTVQYAGQVTIDQALEEGEGQIVAGFEVGTA